jgi:hypothetical protein
MLGLDMSFLETIGGIVAFVVYAYLLYRQNKIMEEQNRIMREQLEQDRGTGSAISTRPVQKWQRLGNYWPMVVMLVLTLATWSALGLYVHFRKPTIIEKPVGKLVPCPEQTAPTVQPIKPAKPLKQSSLKSANPVAETSGAGSVTVNNAPNGFATSGGTLFNPTVNNYGKPDPTFNWKQEASTDQRFIGQGATKITISIDGPMYNAAFVADCDRPCITLDYAHNIPGMWLVKPLFPTTADAKWGICYIEQPNPLLPDGVPVTWTMKSTDGLPLKIVNVRRIKPEELRTKP